jgi:hypothetical protein
MIKNIVMGDLTIDLKQDAGSVTYTFKGNVGDAFKHAEVPRVKSEKITLDLAGITNFNSCGVREWVFLIRDLGNLGDLRFSNCSIAMVDQFNMVPESIGKGTVQTFLAPYVCETHGDQEQILGMATDGNDLVRGEAPHRKCGQCGSDLIFDAMPDSYFLFLTPPSGKLYKAS